MSVIYALLIKEKKRNENMINEYNEELVKLPKGCIKVKKIKNHIYYYLAFRDGNKIVTKYISKNEKDVSKIKELIERRKQIEKIIKKLNEEKIQIKKMEAIL